MECKAFICCLSRKHLTFNESCTVGQTIFGPKNMRSLRFLSETTCTLKSWPNTFCPTVSKGKTVCFLKIKISYRIKRSIWGVKKWFLPVIWPCPTLWPPTASCCCCCEPGFPSRDERISPDKVRHVWLAPGQLHSRKHSCFLSVLLDQDDSLTTSLTTCQQRSHVLSVW